VLLPHPRPPRLILHHCFLQLHLWPDLHSLLSGSQRSEHVAFCISFIVSRVIIVNGEQRAYLMLTVLSYVVHLVCDWVTSL
jgi:hypothetical protein